RRSRRSPRRCSSGCSCTGPGPTGRFFFQAEDGIRDKLVTGVQTCALPILLEHLDSLVVKTTDASGGYGMLIGPASTREEREEFRSEERRVGKECRSRVLPEEIKKKLAQILEFVRGACIIHA